MAITRYDMETKNGDVVIVNNDIVWVVSDEQHIQDTINAFPGWWKENFSDGVGVRNFLSSAGQEQTLARLIKIQLEADAYQVDNPQIQFQPGGQLFINPNAS
jgi:hypothetical protein